MKFTAAYFLLLLQGCSTNPATQLNDGAVKSDTVKATAHGFMPDTTIPVNEADTVTTLTQNKNTATLIKADSTLAQLLAYAQSLIGTPYKYASTNAAQGFDCSGFITHVFNHFNILVPRSSAGFTNYGKQVTATMAMPADLILFTGTDSSSKTVGHMGIITKNENGHIEFIHSTSGKAFGVTVTPLNKYYKQRFVKIIRVFN